MKKFYFLLFAAGMLFANACDKENETVAETPNLQKILAGNYWQERTYPIVLENGVATVSKEKSLAVLQEAVGGGNETHPTFDEDLGIFYVRGDNAVRKYTAFTKENWKIKVCYSCYTLEYGDGWNTLKLVTTKNVFENGWLANEQLRVISASEKRIVLEAPVREYTRKHLNLGEEVIGLQTIWNQIDGNDAANWGNLQNAEPMVGY